MTKLKEKKKEIKREKGQTKIPWSIIGGIIIVIIIALVAYLAFFNKPAYEDKHPARPYYGNPNAKVLVEEFSDFQCPACGQAFILNSPVIEEFKDKIKFEYKHFPLNSLHPNAFPAAVASECALDQNKFWEMYELLFKNQQNLSKENLLNFASQLKLNEESFKACIESGVKDKYVNADKAEGEKRSVQGTPTYFVNGKKLDNWTQLKSEIENVLQ
ncbi:MAG: thioredoxin domain-containing protein [Candidatus Diapherotrites archaeon]